MPTPPQRVRVAVLQYMLHPIERWEQFARQTADQARAAAENGCRVLVFPEYFTLQLIALGDPSRPVADLLRGVAELTPRFVELMTDLATRHGLYIAAGSIPAVAPGDGGLFNDAHVFGPTGGHAVQGKLCLTRWEAEHWGMRPRQGLHVFEADFGRFAVAVCYDVEFPELMRAAARAGCELLLVPSFTNDRQGFYRVRYCAQARAVENTLYVAHACTMGAPPPVLAMAPNYGVASLLTPSDFPFARDGVLAEGEPGLEMMVCGDLDFEMLRDSRENGTVRPLRDSAAIDAAAQPRLITL